MRKLAFLVALALATPASAQPPTDPCAAGDAVKCQLQVTQEALVNAIGMQIQLQAALKMSQAKEAKPAPTETPEVK